MTGIEKFVTPKAAHQYWAKHAYEILTETAGRYDAVITYSELAEEVQRRSSLWTKSPMRGWTGTLLADLVRVSAAREEPALTSLVVHKDDGQVGPGYDAVMRLDGEPVGQANGDTLARETHAAAMRLKCYRHWGADVPADATPKVSVRARAVREATTPRTAAVEPRRGAVCPTCFMEMPVSGPCPNCA